MKNGSLLLLFAAVLVAAAISTLVAILIPDKSPTSEDFTSRKCAKKYFNDSESFVCVCNSTHCDVTPELPQLHLGEVLVITTTRDGARFETQVANFTNVGGAPPRPLQDLVVDTSVKFQEIKGFGGAFTDAASLNFYSLSTASQENFLKSYFSPQGIEYNIGRIPMASTDFSTRLYTYDDMEDDFDLINFALAEEDVKYKIPFIQRAMKMNERSMSFFGSPWSAPAWMKTTNSLVGGQLKSDPKYRSSWAKYFVRFIEEYAKEDINLWAVTAQNEPDIGLREDFPFQCMGYTAEELAEFVTNHLGPTFKERGHENVKIMIGDDQRVLLPDWAGRALNDTGADEFVDGIGIHWYTNMIAPVSKLDSTHAQFPDKFIMATEACAGSVPFLEPKVDLGSWTRGQYYSKDIINNINHWSIAWMDWNMALDLEGGPNWVKNYVDSPIIVNGGKDEFYKQPMFYHMGHFSKFIREGSRRIQISENSETRKFKYTAVLSPQEDHVIVVIINQGEDDVSKTIIDENVGRLPITVPAFSIQTYMWPIKQ